MAKDARESQSRASGLLDEFKEERAAIQRERDAVLQIDAVTTQTHDLMGRVLKGITRGQWLIALLIVGAIMAALITRREVARLQEFERVAVGRFDRIDEKLKRGITIRVEQFETPPFIEGKANCEAFEDHLNPCSNVCMDQTVDPPHSGARCESVSSFAGTMQDAVVVLLAGGHDGTRLSAAARKNFGSNDGLALARASRVEDAIRVALNKSRGKSPYREFPNTRYIPTAKDTRGPKPESPGDRTVHLTVIRAIEAP